MKTVQMHLYAMPVDIVKQMMMQAILQDKTITAVYIEAIKMYLKFINEKN